MATRHKLACGVSALLRHAIEQHKKAFGGRLPRCFALHPEIRHLWALESQGRFVTAPGDIFEGVVITFGRQTEYPVMLAINQEWIAI